MQRIRDYVRFAAGETPTKPATATLDDVLGEIDQWTVPSIIDLLKESRRLSECIRSAEEELRYVDELLDECRTDKENYARQLSVSASRGRSRACDAWS